MAQKRRFPDRTDAGRRLATLLLGYRDESPLVLGLPRGGVPVAFVVARTLEARLDVWVVRKLGVPMQPELGMGALAEPGVALVDETTAAMAGATERDVQEVIDRERAELARRVLRLRRGRPAPDPGGRTVIVVDDGIATGGTARAALTALRELGPKTLVLATPVGATDTLISLRAEADDVVCVDPVDDLSAIGLWYEDFSPTSDEDVIELLEEARA